MLKTLRNWVAAVDIAQAKLLTICVNLCISFRKKVPYIIVKYSGINFISSSIFKNKCQYYYNTHASFLWDFPAQSLKININIIIIHMQVVYEAFQKIFSWFKIFKKKKRHLNANICGQKKDGLSKVDLHLFIRNRLTFIDLGSVFTENAF